MSFRDANQSQIFSNQTLGSGTTSTFGDDVDDVEKLFSIHREDELKGFLSQFPHDKRSEFDKWIRILVKEEVERSHKNEAITITRRSKNFVSRNLELRISNISSPLWTGDHIKNIDGMPVTVTLIDSCTKEELKSGPEASGKVKIEVIEDKYKDGRNKFDCKLVCHMKDEKSYHENTFPLKLRKGTAIFPKVSFAYTKKWMRKSTIRLHARFVDNIDGVHVKEAQTEPFLLKDLHELGCIKHPIPSLDDDVHRLSQINKKGIFIKKLTEAKINTVEGDFIVSLFLDPRLLEEIFYGAKHANRLKAAGEHARKCPAILKYSYSFDKKTEVVFNVSGEVLGLYQEDIFLSGDALSETEKEVAKKLVISAFNDWPNVTRLDKDQFFAHCIHLLNENMLQNGQDQSRQFLPKFSSIRYDEIYHGFETCIPLEQEKNGSCKRLRKLFCFVTFTRYFFSKRSLDDLHAHKKRRLS